MSGKGGINDKFDVIYTRADGTFGEKKGVKKRTSNSLQGKADLASINNENRRSGKWFLMDSDSNKFEIYACGIIAFNGQFIDHRF
jgi:hypothetical protein